MIVHNPRGCATWEATPNPLAWRLHMDPLQRQIRILHTAIAGCLVSLFLLLALLLAQVTP